MTMEMVGNGFSLGVKIGNNILDNKKMSKFIMIDDTVFDEDRRLYEGYLHRDGSSDADDDAAVVVIDGDEEGRL